MNAQLLDIEPEELKFLFVLKKQCSCSVKLTNKTNQYVAFKVKTTSPKKYCVRPNVGIIMPKSVCDFTVTMQAQREAPLDMICRDKFLIQSTVVSAGTNDGDITSATFVKDGGRYIEENKLKVALVSPPHSPVSSTINGTMNQGTYLDASIPKEPVFGRVGIQAPLQTVAKVEQSKTVKFEDVKPKKDAEWKPRKDTSYAGDLKPKKDAELKPRNDVNDEDLTKDAEMKPKNNFFDSPELKPVKDVKSKLTENVLNTEEFKSVKEKEFNALKDGEVKTLKTVEELKLAEDMEKMKSKLTKLESKLGEAEATISKLTEEQRLSTQERMILEEELAFSFWTDMMNGHHLYPWNVFVTLALLRKKANQRRVKMGFPLLFVCMVALIGVFIGYHFAPLTRNQIFHVSSLPIII